MLAKEADNSLLLLFQHIFKKTSPTHSTCLCPTHTNTHSRLVHIQHIHAANSTANKVAYTVQLEAHKLACIVTAHRLPSLPACVFVYSPTLFTMLRLRQEFSTAIFCGLSPFLTSLKEKKTNNQWLAEIRGNVCVCVYRNENMSARSQNTLQLF